MKITDAFKVRIRSQNAKIFYWNSLNFKLIPVPVIVWFLGCVVVEEADGGFKRRLVHIKRPLLRIPSLCIHLQVWGNLFPVKLLLRIWILRSDPHRRAAKPQARFFGRSRWPTFGLILFIGTGHGKWLMGQCQQICYNFFLLLMILNHLKTMGILIWFNLAKIFMCSKNLRCAVPVTESPAPHC